MSSLINEKGKKQWVKIDKRASRIFVHFFAVVARLQLETSHFHVL